MTKKVYSQEDWLTANELWSEREPTPVSFVTLTAAYAIYKWEEETTQSLKNDKKKHCYMGCRIAQSVSQEAAVYIAWLKEYEDLNDCSKSTLFEPLDEKSTLDGARLALTTTEPQDCFTYCSTYKVKK